MITATRHPHMHRAGDVPETDQEIFELLARAIFSAGLGPRVVASRWGGITRWFSNWDARQITKAWADRNHMLVSFLTDPDVVRNRRKVETVLAVADEFAKSDAWSSWFQNLGQEDWDAAVSIFTRRFKVAPGIIEMWLFSCGLRAPVINL